MVSYTIFFSRHCSFKETKFKLIRKWEKTLNIFCKDFALYLVRKKGWWKSDRVFYNSLLLRLCTQIEEQSTRSCASDEILWKSYKKIVVSGNLTSSFTARFHKILRSLIGAIKSLQNCINCAKILRSNKAS